MIGFLEFLAFAGIAFGVLAWTVVVSYFWGEANG